MSAVAMQGIRAVMEIQKGKIVELTIESVAFGGTGVGRVGPMVVFVPFTASGDVVETRIVELKKTFLIGEVVTIRSASEERTEPLCPYFSVCGGCQYQHIRYEAQLKTKERQVGEAFERIGKISDPPVKGIIPSPLSFGYRGKAEFHGIPAPDGTFHMGFMDTEGGRVVDIERCPILEDSINSQFATIKKRLTSGKAPSRRTRYIVWSDSAYPAEGFVTRQVGDKALTVPAGGFFQGNVSLTETLVERTIHICDPKESDRVLDACCGSGLFSIFMAPKVREVIGIEISGSSVRCATQNAEKLGITNVSFQRGDIEKVLSGIAAQKTRIDTVLLDPPRTGCTEGSIDAINSLQPRRVVYVSCNPTTQARDIRHFTEKGFHLELLQPVDMFPQTQHIEVIASLVR